MRLVAVLIFSCLNSSDLKVEEHGIVNVPPLSFDGLEGSCNYIRRKLPRGYCLRKSYHSDEASLLCIYRAMYAPAVSSASSAAQI